MSERTFRGTDELGFRIVDADNHYYEALDAFTRHVDPRYARRGVQWVEIGGKPRILVDGRLNRFIPNPTFDPVARPGALDDYFRGKAPGDDIRAAFGELEPIDPAYRDREARLALMDRQGMEACFLFPTLGVGMEAAMAHDPELAHAVLHGFNRWLDDDWGLNHADRIFSAPLLSLLDPEAALAELGWALDHGARVICLRAAPILTPAGGRSPGDPAYDPFWARAAQAGITVAYHSGESGYHRYAADWGESAEMEAFRYSPFKAVTVGHRPIYDTMAALICHGVLRRHPNLRVATIESGSDWVPELVRRLEKAFKQIPGAFEGVDPVEQLRTNVWVAPFYEDDLRWLADTMGTDRMLMGSDYPHAEGLADPVAYVDDLEGFSSDDVRRIMRENALELSQLRPA